MSLLVLLIASIPLTRIDYLHVETSIQEEYVEIRIKNDGDHTVFIFDGYCDDRTYYSKYLHQYDETLKANYLSLLPLLPYLSVRRSDRLVLGENRVVVRGNSFYHFVPIAPKEQYVLSIPLCAFHKNGFVKRIHAKDYSKFDHQILFEQYTNNTKVPYYVEIAIYQDISILTDMEAYYFKEDEYNKAALSYDILTIPLGVLSSQH